MCIPVTPPTRASKQQNPKVCILCIPPATDLLAVGFFDVDPAAVTTIVLTAFAVVPVVTVAIALICRLVACRWLVVWIQALALP